MTAKKQWLAICLTFALATCGLTACNRERGVQAAGEDRTPTISPAEQDFTMKAAQAHLAEIDMARIAIQKSDNTDVRDYANMIQSDHTRALQDLAELMNDKNVVQPKKVAPDTQKDIDRMNALTGPEFDREFVNMMVGDHQKAVGMFRDQQAIAQNDDIQKYIDDVLPKIEMHLEKAQTLQSKLFSAPSARNRR